MDDLNLRSEQVPAKLRHIKAELFENTNNFGGIVWRSGYPDIHVDRGARIAMVAHSIAADQQIFDFILFEQSQELFEVGW